LNKAFETIRHERTGARRKAAVWPKVYYATQIATNPVTILMFVNNPRLFDEQYQRYVASRLRDLLPISEVPIRLFARSHRSDKPRGRRP
jgi:GTP-binding protein